MPMKRRSVIRCGGKDFNIFIGNTKPLTEKEIEALIGGQILLKCMSKKSN